jgi:hypothetical protein
MNEIDRIPRFLAVLATILCGSWLYGRTIGDGPVLQAHVDQQRIDTGELSFEEIFARGEFLFAAKFNAFDGQGRPGTRGDGAPRVPGSAPRFIRTSAPEANSCAGCHHDPFPGGAGDFAANVFVQAHTLDPVDSSTDAALSNERNTLGMNGAGAIELLAREMTADLIAIRTAALTEARSGNVDITRALLTKGVSFGFIVATPAGAIDSSSVTGVDADLVIRPFQQKGVVVSLREFTNTAFNQHLGMQSIERFTLSDPDLDGVKNELTPGDITAVTVWQAALNVPGQIIPADAKVSRAIILGERTFSRIGCATCHVPALELESPVFSEPSPFNPPGNLQPRHVPRPFTFDLTAAGPLPRLERTGEGRVVVRAFTDLKRHDLCDAELQHFCNERVEQSDVGTRFFITRKLWDAGSSAPYGHRGDLTTLTEAIHFHGGEARQSRDAFFALAEEERAEIVELLKSLQVLPEGTPALVVDEDLRPVDKAAIVARIGRARRRAM